MELGRAVGASGFGRMVTPLNADNVSSQITTSWHHMGTTRMHDDPRRGVVDRNCRVHAIENLFVAGSSVFPTGGRVNPTLTIVALAIRLAEHLKLKVQNQ
jgi:choline dehydrogenase-like flavoprotein